MDEQEAADLIEAELTRYRQRPVAELREIVGKGYHYTIEGASGTTYGVEIQVVFDNHKRADNIRVMGLIGDRTKKFFRRPMSRDFIVRPDGTFIGDD